MKTSKLVLPLVMVISPLWINNAQALSATENSLLHEIRNKTIQLVEKQKQEATKLQACFSKQTSCDSAIKKNLNTLRRTITYKNEEYRILTALSSKSFFFTEKDLVYPPSSAKLNITTPPIFLNKVARAPRISEFEVINHIGRADARALTSESEQFYSRLPIRGNYDPTGERIKLHKKEASEFYKIQSIIAVQSVPFVVYLKNDAPTDADIATALNSYIQKNNEVLSDLKDLKENPLETFLIYEPVVRSVIKSSKEKQRLVQQMLHDQKHQVGIKAWLERNSMSLKFAAFTTCSFVGAVVQSWPLSISCGSAMIYLTSKQLYTDYFKMQDSFALWLSGAQSYQQLRTAEARTLYSSLALFFAGQGIYSTIARIESGLISTLNELPHAIATRFTSLTALREGGARFAATQANFKSKDLGASIFAETAAEDVDPTKLSSRRERIFSYRDLLKLREEMLRQ